MKTFIGNHSDLSQRYLIISWPGHEIHFPLNKLEYRLGRAANNDIRIDYEVVSRWHATIRKEENDYYIYDGQTREQFQKSANGLYFKNERIGKHKFKPGDMIRIPGRNEDFIAIRYYDSDAVEPIKQVWLNQSVTIGRDMQNSFPLDGPTVSRFHARLDVLPNGQGHQLTDLNSGNGTFVNGKRIKAPTPLQYNDVIQIGNFQLRYDGQQLFPAGAQLGQPVSGIRIDAFRITKIVKDKKTKKEKPLLNDISLSITGGEFVALVGGSGAGKSTLLDALNGSRRATSGTVLINGDDLYDNFDAYRHTIGYVPQDDIIHKELTVREALRFAARLRLPADITTAKIEERIEDVLRKVSMPPDKKDLPIKDLSGGQRKRVSIAVELIADPQIIFLDEPTSGLDPGLDQKMMFTLHELSREGKTVILVTHATGNITYCDMVAFLAFGGHLVYYGPPNEAPKFFHKENFASIYNELDDNDPQRRDSKINHRKQTFNGSDHYQKFIDARLGHKCPRCKATIFQGQTFCTNCNYSLNTNPTMNLNANSHINSGKPNLLRQVGTIIRQWAILTQRYLTILSRDRSNLLFLLLQSPIIALLLFLVTDSNLFSKGINIEPDDIGSIQKILFIIACIATWFGAINTVREIVKEMPIYARERLANLSILAYVGSKAFVLTGLAIIQAFLLVVIIGLHLAFPWEGATFLPGPLEIFITVLLVILTASAFGLFLSATVGKEDRAMTLMPVFLIPQIVFAGIVFTLEGWADYISYITFSRWGIEALGSTVNLPTLSREASFSGVVPELPFEFLHQASYLFQTWAILMGYIILFIWGTIISLKRQVG